MYGRAAAFDGVGFGSRCMAYDGLTCQVPQPIVPVAKTTKKSKRRSQTNAARVGAGSWLVPAPLVFEITDTELERLAERIVAFAESPELRTWTSSVLSNEGRRGTDLSTESALSETLLKAVQHAEFPLREPTARALYLAAGLLAIGLPTTLVAHGDLQLTRALAAVHADGLWRYADPNGPNLFGHSPPFLRERAIQLAPLANPQADELAQFKKQIDEQRQVIDELHAQLDAIQEALELDLGSVSVSTSSAPASNERIYKYVAVGALGLLVVTLYLLHRERKKRKELDS